MDRSFRRIFVLVTAVALLAGACSAGSPPQGATSWPVTAEQSPEPSPSAPTLPPTGSQPPTGNTGNTGNTGDRVPELSVAEGGPGYLIELRDPMARAWRIILAGPSGADRLEIEVEVGDIRPGVVVRTFVDGRLAGEDDLTAMIGDPTSAAGGCHPVLQACYGSGGINVDLDSGTVGVVIEQIEPTAVEIAGSTAGWTDEPFVLGAWRSTAPFRTAPGG